MGRNIDEVIAALPKARQQKIQKKSEQLAAEMIAHADKLAEVRRLAHKTQGDVARELGIGQVAVAQLEQRSDFLLSTLQRYLGALGAKLKLVVQTDDGKEVVLKNLGELFFENAQVAPRGTSVKRVSGPRGATTGRKPSANRKVSASSKQAVNAQKPGVAKKSYKSAGKAA